MQPKLHVSRVLLSVLTITIVFTSLLAQVGVIWDLSVKKIDDKTYRFTNTIHSSATPELIDFLGKQGTPMEVFQATRKPV